MKTVGTFLNDPLSKQLIEKEKPEITLKFNERGHRDKRGGIRTLRVKCFAAIERAQQTYLIVKTLTNSPITGIKLSIGSGTLIVES